MYFGPLKALIAASLLAVPMSVQSKAERYPCFWANGRLMAYNGNPTFRIWPRKTSRLLGVVAERGDTDDQNTGLPPDIERLNPVFGRHIWGSFYVCPVTEERRGWMRFVLLKKGRNLTVTDHRERR
jgi:hypothetical protein